jgi:hypothetical protein
MKQSCMPTIVLMQALSSLFAVQRTKRSSEPFRALMFLIESKIYPAVFDVVVVIRIKQIANMAVYNLLWCIFIFFLLYIIICFLMLVVVMIF